MVAISVSGTPQIRRLNSHVFPVLKSQNSYAIQQPLNLRIIGLNTLYEIFEDNRGVVDHDDPQIQEKLLNLKNATTLLKREVDIFNSDMTNSKVIYSTNLISLVQSSNIDQQRHTRSLDRTSIRNILQNLRNNPGDSVQLGLIQNIINDINTIENVGRRENRYAKLATIIIEQTLHAKLLPKNELFEITKFALDQSEDNPEEYVLSSENGESLAIKLLEHFYSKI